MKQKMLDRVAGLGRTLDSVSQLAQDVDSIGQKLTSGIKSLNDSLVSIQAPISTLESAILKVHSGVHIAQELDSVFKPLQWLLTDFHCIPDKRPEKLVYLKLVQSFTGIPGLNP